ncbi:MAG TPA: surface carbohydrate biosynthesis protein [Gemmatimonadaceae bacterium]
MLAASTITDQRCRVLIAVPNLLRDLEGHALIAYHLQARYGHDVELCMLSQVDERTLRYAPDVLVLDRIDTKVPLVRRARQLGMKVVLLPTVGFHQDGLATEARRAGGLVRGEELLDRCFTWGSHGRDILRKRTRLTDEQVRVVGAPRFDAYSEPFLSLCEGKDSFLRRIGVDATDAPLVVWSTNTFHRRTKDLASTIAGAVATGVPENEIRGQLEDEGTAFREISSAVSILAERHPEWSFLIKLHPSELPGPYRVLAEGRPNIHVCGDERIRDVLLHCDVLLTQCSTTATEAWMLGKPVIEVMIGHYLVPPPREYLEGNHTVTELDEMERLLSRCLREPHAAVPDDQQCARDAFLSGVYHRIDGRASERCAEEIDQLLAVPRHTAERQAEIRAAAGAARASWQRTVERHPANRLRRLLGLPADAPLRFWKREFWKRSAERANRPSALRRELTPEMIEELYRGFDSVLQPSEPASARHSATAAIRSPT